MFSIRSAATMLLLVAALHAGAARAERPRAYVPPQRSTVVDVLPRGYASAVPSRTSVVPRDAVPVLLSEAARSGDARLVDRAEALLDRGAGIDARQVPDARAYIAQYRHDFPVARAWLARAIAARPTDPQPRLSLAYIELVQGKVSDAARTCATDVVRRDPSASDLCLAAVDLRCGRYGSAAGRVDRWLARHPVRDAASRSALVLRGDIAARATDPRADGWYRRALFIDPGDVRTIAAFARHLRTSGHPRDVLRLLAGAPDSDRLLLESALASRATRHADATALAARLASRYRDSRRLGAAPELADESLFALETGASTRALDLALQNVRTQRDHDDVALLLRAARKAGRPDAVELLREWAQREGVASADGLAP